MTDRGFAVKRGRLSREMKNRQVTTPAALARAAGVHRSTAGDVLAGKALAGPKFAQGLTRAWGLEINDLFEEPKPQRKKATK